MERLADDGVTSSEQMRTETGETIQDPGAVLEPQMRTLATNEGVIEPKHLQEARKGWMQVVPEPQASACRGTGKYSSQIERPLHSKILTCPRA
jgi:hypothetical protein